MREHVQHDTMRDKRDCRIELDSINPWGNRLITYEIRMPRVVLAETVTHRLDYDTMGGYEETTWTERTMTREESKNSASSRAVPFWKMLRDVITDPYIPDRFGKAGPGMQPAGYFEGEEHEACVKKWLIARNDAIRNALAYVSAADLEIIDAKVPEIERFVSIGNLEQSAPVHSLSKGDINRLIEPWAYVTQIVTSSGWDNFLALRCHKDAFFPIRRLARLMFMARRESIPEAISHGQWHLPYVESGDRKTFHYEPRWHGNHIAAQVTGEMPLLIKASVARCAWLSYNNHGQDGSEASILSTYSRLVGGVPRHGSPAEHQGTPHTAYSNSIESLRSNLEGWLQARKLIPDERIMNFAPSDEVIESWKND